MILMARGVLFIFGCNYGSRSCLSESEEYKVNAKVIYKIIISEQYRNILYFQMDQ